MFKIIFFSYRETYKKFGQFGQFFYFMFNYISFFINLKSHYLVNYRSIIDNLSQCKNKVNVNVKIKKISM